MVNSNLYNLKSGFLMISAFFCCMSYGISQPPDFSPIFKACHVDGSIVIYDYGKKTEIQSNGADAHKETLPASTFKIFNSLVALQEKVVKDENEVIKWDSIDRGNKNWNADTDLKGAFKNSTLWFYQEIARRVGKEKYAYYFDKYRYGNKTIGKDVDKFWIDGSLKISPVQQINFLVSLYKNELPFSLDVQQKVKDIMLYETTEQYKIYAKTGWGFENGVEIGWWVGFLQKKENVYFFATRITLPEDVKNENFGNCRKTITYDCFKLMGVIN